MSSNGTNNYDIYSTENTSPLEEPEPIPPFELEATKADTLEEYDAGGYGDGDDDGDNEGGNNNSRLFMILLGALAGLFIISIIVMVLLSQVILPGRSARQTEQAKLILGENEATIVAATETAQAAAVSAELTRIALEASPTFTPTETVMVPTATEEPPQAVTNTPQPALPTDTPEAAEVTPDMTQTEAALQATADALSTQAASSPTPTEEGAAAPTLNAAQMTATAVASGGAGGAGAGDGDADELPDTGFMDDGGIYVMGVAAVLLVGVIIGARKLRKAN